MRGIKRVIIFLTRNKTQKVSNCEHCMPGRLDACMIEQADVTRW